MVNETEHLATKIREHALLMAARANASHIASVLSCADIIAVLFVEAMRLRPKEPEWSQRDRFVLSKGHAGAGLYAVLAETGFFDPMLLETYCQNGSVLGGHVSHKGVPGVEVSTGSLGHGLGLASGMAFALGLASGVERVFCLLSDGECDEGSTWEGALFAGHHKLDNLIAVIDYNQWQGYGTVSDAMELEPLADKWRSFGWQVQECDGHDHADLKRHLNSTVGKPGMPTMVIAHTIKGKGVSFMENELAWHYKSPQAEDLKAALSQVRRR